MTAPSSWIVIDTNVARSCANPARHDTSAACLELVQIVAQRGHPVGVILTPALVLEWRKHGSPYFLSWWASMEARRRIRAVDDRPVREYRTVIDGVPDEGVRLALIKDCHLVELALLVRVPVASQDDHQVRHLQTLLDAYPLVGRVQWFNPVSGPEWREWLDTGCSDLAFATVAA